MTSRSLLESECVVVKEKGNFDCGVKLPAQVMWKGIAIVAGRYVLDCFLWQHSQGMLCSSWALHGLSAGVIFMECFQSWHMQWSEINKDAFIFSLFLCSFCIFFVFPSCGVTEAQASSGCSGGMEGCENKPVFLPSPLSVHFPLPSHFAFPVCPFLQSYGDLLTLRDAVLCLSAYICWTEFNLNWQ